MKHKFIRLTLALAPVVFGTVLYAYQPGACQPEAAKPGEVVTCLSPDGDGYYSPNGGLTVNVQDAVTVANPNNNANAIRLHSGNTIINDGSVTGINGGDGIKVEANNTLINNGIISSERHDAVDVESGNTIINLGTISTGTVTNPTIGDKAIDSNHNTNILNHAVIDGNGGGISTGAGSTITNHSGGTIHSEFRDGIDAEDHTVIYNYGSISTGMDAANDAVDIDNYSIVNNYGSIRGYCDGIEILQHSTVSNAAGAEIYGEHCNGIQASAYTTISNSGSITTGAEGIFGVRLDYDSLLVNTETGVIEGFCRAVKGTNNATLDNAGRLHGETCDGVDIDGVGTVINAGTITTKADAAVEIDGGSIINSGILDGASNGIRIEGAGVSTIVNNFIIRGNTGISAVNSPDSQIIINNGTIVGETGTAIQLGAGNDELNTLVGAKIQGIMDCGSGEDILQFRYRFAGTIPAEYTAMEATLRAAPTTGCPCSLQLIVNGTAYNYQYTNFERLAIITEQLYR